MYIYNQKKPKWNHQIIGEEMLQLDIFCHQVRPLVPEMGYIQLNFWPKQPCENPQTTLQKCN